VGDKLKKRKAVPLGAGDFAGDGAEGPIGPTFELESIHQDLHDDPAALVLALQVGAVRWEPRVEVAGHRARDAQLRIQRRILPEHGPGRPDAQVGVVRNLQRAAAGTLGQAALGQRLDAPGDPPKQEPLVVRAGFFAEHLRVLLAELADRHPTRRLNLFLHLHRGHHAFLLSQDR